MRVMVCVVALVFLSRGVERCIFNLQKCAHVVRVFDQEEEYDEPSVPGGAPMAPRAAEQRQGAEDASKRPRIRVVDVCGRSYRKVEMQHAGQQGRRR
jgi:hypothetical protein